MIAKLLTPLVFKIGGGIILALAMALAFAMWRADGLSDQVQRYKAAKQAAQAAYRAEVARRATIATEYEREASTNAQIHTIREREIETIYHDVLVPAECAAPDAVRGVLSEAVAASNSASSGEPISELSTVAEPAATAD